MFNLPTPGSFHNSCLCGGPALVAWGLDPWASSSSPLTTVGIMARMGYAIHTLPMISPLDSGWTELVSIHIRIHDPVLSLDISLIYHPTSGNSFLLFTENLPSFMLPRLSHLPLSSSSLSSTFVAVTTCQQC